MSSLRAVERAYDVRKSIPREMHHSAGPRVWSGCRTVWPAKIANGALQRINNCQSEIASATGDHGFTQVGVLVASQLRYGRFLDDTTANPIEYGELQALLRCGQLPCGFPASDDLPTLDVDCIQRLGYQIPAQSPKTREETEAEQNAFTAARHLMLRRASPQVLYLASRFVVHDPLVSKKTAYVLSQLAVAREFHSDRVRLLGLDIGPDLAGSTDQVRRDEALAREGVEVFHASMSWARIDPLRMECDFLQRAGVAVLPQFEPSIVGRTIADYMCSFCDGPMLRSPSGEGIAFVANDEPVHEECFNPAVDFGY